MKKGKYDKYGSKEDQRNKLKELAGSVVSCRGKFTRGVQTRDMERRLVMDITVFLRNGEKLHLHHLWIPNKREYVRYEGRVLDFRAEVYLWDYAKTKAGVRNIFVGKYEKRSKS